MIKNNIGSIGIALIIILISTLSGFTLSMIAFNDTKSFRQQLQMVQQLHLLRSEVGRARLICSHLELEATNEGNIHTILPIRNINIQFKNFRTIYNAKTKIKYMPSSKQKGYKISTLTTANRYNEISPIKKYSENFIQSLQTLAIFHYFTDQDLDHSGIPGNIRFFGQDVIYGRVHSNTDIWIRQAGGGTNNGWPTFHELVTTSGEIRVYDGGSCPTLQVFRGGLIQNYPPIIFQPTAELVRRNGLSPYGHTPIDNQIAFVTINNTSYNISIGYITSTTVDTLIIYDSYPPYGAIGNQIGMNIISRIDTTWAPGSVGSLNNRSIFIPFQLWISGNVGSGQTWASTHNIYIKDDITYYRTIPGLPPDGGIDNNYPINNSDYFGLISQKHILIQYGYKHPQTNIRYKPNTNNIYLYGAYCAMGQGSGIEPDHDKGVVTFQYQFPKGSTPDQVWQGDLYTNIDLHRFKYPTSPFNPWLPGLDYPWYNPLWKQAGTAFGHPLIPNPHNAPMITLLRGTINLYGSIAQRRRGFVRRSGNPDFDTNYDNPYWDLENNIFGRHTGVPTGYNKNYNFDTRFERIGPPDFPLVKFEGYETDELMDLGFKTIKWIFKSPPNIF